MYLTLESAANRWQLTADHCPLTVDGCTVQTAWWLLIVVSFLVRRWPPKFTRKKNPKKIKKEKDACLTRSSIHVTDLISRANKTERNTDFPCCLSPPFPSLPPSFARSVCMVTFAAALRRCEVYQHDGSMNTGRWQQWPDFSRAVAWFKLQIESKKAPCVVRREEEISRLDEFDPREKQR